MTNTSTADPYLKQAQNRILLVEDNDINQLVAQGMLENLGIRSDIAGNGLAALQSLQSSTSYQLILMDCQMPEMDGYEIAQWRSETEKRGKTTKAFQLLP